MYDACEPEFSYFSFCVVRLVVYEDGDKEHLSLYQLQKLAKKEVFRSTDNDIDDDKSTLLSPLAVKHKVSMKHTNEVNIATAISCVPPVQVQNQHNSCFAHVLIQNIVSSVPLRTAILDSLPISNGLVCLPKYDVAYDCILLFLQHIFNSKPGHIIKRPEQLFQAMRCCQSTQYSFGDSICPIEFLHTILIQLTEHDCQHYFIFDVLNFCNQTTSKLDCMNCGMFLKQSWVASEDVMHPSMIGINPPIGDLLDLPDLIKMSLHDQKVELCHPMFCKTCNKTVRLVYENKYFQLDKGLIPQVLLIQVVPRLNDNNEWMNPFHVPVEMDMTDFMNVSNIEDNKDRLTPIVASLTGFIQHIRGESRKKLMERQSSVAITLVQQKVLLTIISIFQMICSQTNQRM